MVIRVEPERMTSGSLLTQVAHRRCNLLAQLGERAAQGGHGGWCPGAGSRAGEIGVGGRLPCDVGAGPSGGAIAVSTKKRDRSGCGESMLHAVTRTMVATATKCRHGFLIGCSWSCP